MFTTIFHLLGKKKKIKHHLLKYNPFNKYEYITTYYRPIVTLDLGSNYPLDEELRKEIIKKGIVFRNLDRKPFVNCDKNYDKILARRLKK